MSHGRYSRTAQKAITNGAAAHSFHNDPPSERTRSQTLLRGRFSTQPRLPPHPHTGTFRPLHTTPTSQARATRRLHRSRLKLKRYITTDRWQLDDPHATLPEPTAAQTAQLGTLSGSREILRRPAAGPGTWRSEGRMRRRRGDPRRGMNREAEQTAMREFWQHYSEQEKDDVLGVVPGEEWCAWAALAPGVGVDAMMCRIMEEKCVQAIEDGEGVEGVWRDVVERWGGGGVDEIVRWVREEKKKWEGRVLDPECVQIVRGVMGVEETLS